MALTYEQVIDVISQAPDRRKDFEVNNLLSWFRKKSQLFASLKTELLFDIIKNLQFVTKTTDELIIRQGDKGDCMYILLRGKVTIYIWYNKTDAPNDDQVDGVVVPVLAPGSPATIRLQLGTFVTSLGPGATFGEVALRQEDDCIRTASIIADETCDLIVVDRELYNRSVKYVLKKEFDDKLSFVLSHPVLRGWAPRYRKQLAMALEKNVYAYESNITRQADRVDAMYFVLSGEVKLTVDKEALKTQYPKYYFNDENRSPWWKENSDSVDVSDTSRDARKSQALSTKGQKKSKLNKHKSTVDVCLISSNEPIGDLEILMGLDSYCQTATATQRTDVLVLERKHYDRLMVKRNPYTVDMMRQSLELRLHLRMTRLAEANVGLMMKLLQQTQVANEQRRQRQELQQARLAAKNQLTSAAPASSAPTSSTVGDQGQQEQQQQLSSSSPLNCNGVDVTAKFIPSQGALVNMYGPGTVFHWIRQNAGSRRSKYGKSALGLLGSPSSTSLISQQQQQLTTARDRRDGYTNSNYGNSNGQQQSSPAGLGEDKLALIESRIQQWMASGAALHSSQARTRVAPLRRLAVARDVF